MTGIEFTKVARRARHDVVVTFSGFGATLTSH